jgi:hypothetical protein
MAVLTVQDGSAGIQDVTMNACTGGGDSVAGGVKLGGWSLPVVLVVRNGDASSKTVTVQGVAYIVPATTGTAVIPVNSGYHYGDSVAITYSAVTSLTIGAVRLTGPLS